jgi:hypothetical protein
MPYRHRTAQLKVQLDAAAPPANALTSSVCVPSTASALRAIAVSSAEAVAVVTGAIACKPPSALSFEIFLTARTYDPYLFVWSGEVIRCAGKIAAAQGV